MTGSTDSDERGRPLGRQLFLAVSFVALVVVGVFTVLLPSLQDDVEAPTRGHDAGAQATDAGAP